MAQSWRTMESMRNVLIVVAASMLTGSGCGDNVYVAPDAPDPFGAACMNHGTAPLESCIAADEIGWCIATENESGICRRACGEECKPGEIPTAVYDDCYCKP